MTLPPKPPKKKTLEKHRVSQAHRTPPKGYPKERSAYADPNNYKYPIDSERHVRAALAYFSRPKNRKGYTDAEAKAIFGRILKAAKKYGIEISEEVEERA